MRRIYRISSPKYTIAIATRENNIHTYFQKWFQELGSAYVMTHIHMLGFVYTMNTPWDI